MIALVGAGPLGLEMAVALKRAGLSYAHFEAGPIGSTMAWWPAGTRWFSSPDRISIAGVPLITAGQEKATREEYLAYLRMIVLQFNLQIRTYTRVTSIRPAPPSTRCRYVMNFRRALFPNAPEETAAFDQIILATGGTAVPNLLHVPGEDLPHVSHYFRDPHPYFNQRLLIVGGRNSAVEAALRCHHAGAKVHMSYRHAAVDPKEIKHWLYPEFASLVQAGAIVGHFNTAVREITPADVLLASTGGGVEEAGAAEESRLPVDFVLLLTGYRADMALAAAAGIKLEGAAQVPAFNERTMETNVPGIYIAGTAIAGTQQRYMVFLENCHIHVERILAHLRGQSPPEPVEAAAVLERPES